MAKPICRNFATGKCRYGDKCRFSHENAAEGDTNRRAVQRNGDDDDDASSLLLKTWRFSIPKAKDRLRSKPLGDDALAKFLDQTLQLINSGSEKMQLVVIDLASETGLIRTREVLDRKYDSMSDTMLDKVWKKLLLPYFKILSHEHVLQSAVVEVRHATLMNDLYGVSGRQGATVFKAAARYLSDRHTTDEMEATLAVLACMLEKNSGAKVNEELQAAADVILSLLDFSSLDRASTRFVRTIRTALQLGTNIPDANSGSLSVKTRDVKPTFTVAQDMPGEQSSNGPRHDNDFPDIRDIQILPTMEEVVSARLEYLPREDPAEWHTSGLAGLIDRQFRLVREDTVGQLRDAAGFQLERLQNPQAALVPERQLARTYTYNNVSLENVVFHDQKGLLFVFSFDQPHSLRDKSKRHRQGWWEDSRRLSSDALICLLSSEGDATFLAVTGAGHTKEDEALYGKYTLASDPSRANIVAVLTDSNPSHATKLLLHCTTASAAQRSIIEFPGVVLPAFAPTLTALQQIAETLDLPFSDLLVPGPTAVELRAPAYSLREGFRFDLHGLLPDHQSEQPPAPDSRDRIPQSMIDRSTLDDAQRKAVRHSLEHCLSLIQGPPGTGKSFTGVKLIKTLLDNNQTGKLGPIICVCYTNHALDQLLEHLIDAGVRQLIRIGSRSKSERLASVNIRAVAKNYSFTKTEGRSWGKAKESIKQTCKAMDALILRLDQITVDPDGQVLEFLKEYHAAVHAQLLCNNDDEEGWTTVIRGNQLSPLQAWLQSSGPANPFRSRPIAVLESGRIPLSHMSVHERQTLYQSWIEQILRSIYQDLEIQLNAFNDDKETIDSLRGEVDLRILSGASVIGITTTGLARNLQYLRKLKSKVLVVEEAGEVLEAHLLTAMLPSLEHAILIGDHQQLRPKVQNYELSVENPRSQIALDVSLFERLVHPRIEGACAVPFVSLETETYASFRLPTHS